MRLASYKRFDLARVLLHSPYYPSLKNCPMLPFDILTALQSIQTYEQGSAALVLEFLRKEFVQQHAEHQWKRILNGYDTEGKTILHACIERDRPDLCT